MPAKQNKQFRYFGELVCGIISVSSFIALKLINPAFSKDAAISISADASLLLVAGLHNTNGDEKKSRAARMCLLCAISCSCWLVTMGNRSSSNVFFEASFMVLLPFVGGLMKTASAWYFRQREVPEADIRAVNQFYWLHFIVVFAGMYSLQYPADVDETKKSLQELQVC